MTTNEEAARTKVLERLRERLSTVQKRLIIERKSDFVFSLRVTDGNALVLTQRLDKFKLNGGYSKKIESVTYRGQCYETSGSQWGGFVADVAVEIEIITPTGTKSGLPGKEHAELFVSDKLTKLSIEKNGGIAVFKIPEKLYMPQAFALPDLEKINRSIMLTADILQDSSGFKVTFHSNIFYGLDREKTCGEIVERKLHIHLVEYYVIALHSSFKARAIVGYYVQKIPIPPEYELKPLIDGSENGSTTFFFKPISKPK